MRGLPLAAVVLVLAGGAVWASASPDPVAPGRDSAEPPRRAPADDADRRERTAPRRRVRASRCPAGLTGCRTARGRIVYVEAVDPDGDGDLHVVIAGGGVTAAGLTAVDVRPGLRPQRDPRIGDEASAAGQVQRGSFGQAQIHAVEFHVRRRR